MKKVIDVLKEKMVEGFVGAGYDAKYGMVSVSNRPDLCQYQCNGAMMAAKEYKKAPFMIADNILEYIKDTLNSYKIKEINFKEETYHHNSSYKNGTSIIKSDLLARQMSTAFEVSRRRHCSDVNEGSFIIFKNFASIMEEACFMLKLNISCLFLK